MKRIISFFLFLLLLLPTMAQKPFTMRVVAGKDYPYYIHNVQGSIFEPTDNKNKNVSFDSKDLDFDKRDNRTYIFNYDTKKIGRIRLNNVNTIDQDGEWYYFQDFLSIPIIPGEQLTVTLHDAWNYEIDGSQFYREYGKAYHAMMQKKESAKDYIAKHRKERGCALLVLTEPLFFDEVLQGTREERFNLFDSTTISFLDDLRQTNKLLVINCNNLTPYVAKTYGFFGTEKRNNQIGKLDRQLEGQTIIDTIGQMYKGKPTLVTIWTYRTTNLNNEPKAYELYLHAKDMNRVFLNSFENGNIKNEYYWKASLHRQLGDYYLLMRDQVDSLFQHYMPGVKYPDDKRQFYILLDAEGKVVDYGDLQHNYRQLIAKTDQLKAEAGLPPFKGAPYKVKYLDLDVEKQTEPGKEHIISQAQLRMSYTAFFPIEGHETARYGTYALYTANSKQLNISQRLYDIAKQDIEELNKKNYENILKHIFEEEVRKVKQKDDYQPDLEKHRQEMTVGKPVDLGLSVKWADINVGAKAAEETGMYFTWGDPEPLKDDPYIGRSWSLYRWCKGTAKTLRKYNTKTENGPIDMRTTVLPEDDAATIYWQGDWRTPSQQEADELLLKCQWEWTTQNGHNGYKVTGPNGNSIFIPAAGCLNFQGLYGAEEHGYYWTTDLNVGKPNECYYLHFRKGKSEIWSNERFDGRCIRPVCK